MGTTTMPLYRISCRSAVCLWALALVLPTPVLASDAMPLYAAIARQPPAYSATAARDAARAGAWIEIDRPPGGEAVRFPIGIVELRGRIGGGARGYDDLVIAVDRSRSAMLPSGLDLDGDGITGALVDPRWNPSAVAVRAWTTDADDVLIRSSLLAVRQVLRSLDPARTRVAVLSFAGDAEILAPLGPLSAAYAALARVRADEDSSGSNLAAAVQGGLRLLEQAQPRGETQRAILVLSDGFPTAPRNPTQAARRARALARYASDQGVKLYTFQMRNAQSPEETASKVLADMAALSGGAALQVDRPAQLRFELPHPLGDRAEQLTILNQTSGEPARAVRLWANGSFDGFLPLVPGLNRVQIAAQLQDGRAVQVERVIDYVPQESSPRNAEKIETFLGELGRRTQETESWADTVQRSAASRSLRVTLQPEAPPPSPGEAE